MYRDAVRRIEGFLGLLVADKLKRTDQTASTRVSDERMICERAESSLKERRDILDVPYNVLFFVYFQGLECDCSGDRVPAIGKAVPEGADLLAFGDDCATLNAKRDAKDDETR